MTTREQVEAEAAELYPTPADPYTPHEAFQERAAHVRAKTISAEQLEAAAEALRPGPNIADEMVIRHSYYVDKARRTLEAAGLLIEGEGHEQDTE